MQGFGDNVCGTLSWASCVPVEDGDWVSCPGVTKHSARSHADLNHPESVMVEGTEDNSKM